VKPGEKAYLLNFVSKLVDALGQTFGKYCEIVVHDFNSPESSIIAIANGALTGREVGAVSYTHLDVYKRQIADFFLIAGDPTRDIRAIKSPRMVFQRESIYFPSEIYQELSIKPFASPPKIRPAASRENDAPGKSL